MFVTFCFFFLHSALIAGMSFAGRCTSLIGPDRTQPCPLLITVGSKYPMCDSCIVEHIVEHTTSETRGCVPFDPVASRPSVPISASSSESQVQYKIIIIVIIISLRWCSVGVVPVISHDLVAVIFFFHRRL